MKAELIAHFFWTIPAYRTMRPGTLCSPTSVAAVICQALSPWFSQSGFGLALAQFDVAISAAWRAWRSEIRRGASAAGEKERARMKPMAFWGGEEMRIATRGSRKGRGRGRGGGRWGGQAQ